jgi:hypothetical protein
MPKSINRKEMHMAKIKYATQLEALETAEVSRAVAKRNELTNARYAATKAVTDLALAQEKVAVIHHGWRRGSDEFTPEDFALATARVTQCNDRIAGAEQELAIAERSSVNEDKSLAIAVADLVRAAMPDVPVYATFATESTLKPGVDEFPLAVVIQTSPTEYLKSGGLVGNVTIRLYRSKMTIPLPLKDIRSVAEKTGHANLGIMHTPAPVQTGEGFLDQTTVPVQSIVPSVPVILRIEATRVQGGLGNSIVNTAIGRLRGSHGRDEGIMVKGCSVGLRAVTLAYGKHEVLTEEIESGVRTLVVDVPVLYRQHGPPKTAIPKALDETARDLSGTFVSGLGNVLSVKVVDNESALWLADRRTLVGSIEDPSGLPSDASQIGRENVGQRVYRITIESAVK